MIKQTVFLKAKPQEVYEALMDEKKHSAFTGAKAKIEKKVGGKFSVWDNYASGKFLGLEMNKKIVQLWTASDWPEGAVSTLTITLTAKDDGTTLEMVQDNVPKAFEKEVTQGWKDYYWEPLKAYLEG